MTKRLICSFTILYFLLTAPQLFAQLKFGVKGGISLTKAAFDDSETHFAPRLHAGIFAHVALNNSLYLKPELLYAQKGWQVSGGSIDPDDVSVTINYVNIPVLVGYNVIPKISVIAGPEVGFKLSAKRKPSPSSWVDTMEKVDIGIAVGSNFSLSQNLGIDLRYIHGFEGLYKAEGRDYNNAPTGEVFRSGRNQAIELGVFYIF